MYSLDVRGMLRLLLDLFSHASDIHVHASRCDAAVISPDSIQQMISRKNHAGVRGQIVKEAELQCAEFNVTPRNAHRMRGGIDVQIASLEVASLWRGFVPSQQCPNPRDEFAHAEGLCDVVISSEFEADHAVGFFASRRQHE